MFWKKKKEIEATEPSKESSWEKSNIDFVGFKHDDPDAVVVGGNRAFGITSTERGHMAIFGFPGCGKSSILKLLAYQNIMRKQGVMIIDPHGELARDIMSMIPKERWKDVIYVNPATLYRFGKTVQVNPLEVKSENERYVVVMTFVNTLYNLYMGSWGPRLETVLRNAANALVESKGYNSLGFISSMITDESSREEILENVASPGVKHFWREIFHKQYSKDAGSSAYNKIDKILATPTVAAMFDCTESSIDISEVISEKKILVVDLSTGASDDIAKFLGSIFLNMLHVEAKRRMDILDEDLSEIRKNPFYVYVDEAHMFSNMTMSEMLRALRKFGIKVTLATQTCNAYDKTFADEIPGTCKTVMTGKCDFNTASLLNSQISVTADQMQRLPNHTFVMSTDESGVGASATFRARPVPLPGRRVSEWKDVARESLKRWGKDVSIEKYAPTQNLGKLLFNPLECSIIHLMHFDQRDWYRNEIFTRVQIIFPSLKEKPISVALDSLVRKRYIKIMYPGTDDGDENETMKRYVVSSKTYSTYLSQSAAGRRAGGEVHLAIMFGLMDLNMKQHRYCIPDLGDSSENAADLLVIEPKVLKDKDGLETYDPFHWNDNNKLAIEVETGPTKHIKQAVQNYTKNFEAGYMVWFVCFGENHRKKLEAAIYKKHPNPKGMYMDVINHVSVIQGKQKMPDTYNEILSKVKVRGIDSVLKMTEEEKNTKKPVRTSTDIAQLESANKTAKSKNIEESFTATGTDPEPCIVKTRAEMEAEGEAQTNTVRGKSGPYMNDLEYSIFEIIQKGAGHKIDDEEIIKKLGINVSKNKVHNAITNMIMKKAVRRETMEVQYKRGSVDGSGDRHFTKKQGILVVYDERMDPTMKDEDLIGGADAKMQKNHDVKKEEGDDAVPEAGDDDVDAKIEKTADDGSEMQKTERPVIDSDIDFSEMTDTKLLAMLSDDIMSKDHAKISAELEERGVL